MSEAISIEKLYFRRTIIKEIKKKTEESKVSYQEINDLKSVNYALGEEISHIKEDTINIKEELVARLETLNHFKKQYEDLIDENDESKKLNYFSNLKQIFIKNKFEEILEDKIPSCNSSRKAPQAMENDNKNNNLETFGSIKNIIKKNMEINDRKENEFNNLIFNTISIRYVIYDPVDPTQLINEDFQIFRITKFTTFLILKKLACIFWCIENDSDYIIIENCEAMIYNEENIINKFLNDYSITKNVFKLMNLHTLKSRNAILGIQSIELREGNKNLRGDIKGDDDLNENNNKFVQLEIKNFLNDYPGLKMYLLGEKGIKEEAAAAIHNESEFKLDNSFLMIILLLTLLIMTYFFLSISRDIGRTYKNSFFMNTIFKPINKISNFNDMKAYLINNVGNTLLNTTYMFNNSFLLYNDIPSLVSSYDPFEIEKATAHFNQTNYIFFLVSSLRIIVNNVNNYTKTTVSSADTALNNLSPSAFYQYYSTDNSPIYSNNINNVYLNSSLPGLKNMSMFQTSSQSNVNLNIQGSAGFYDGSGFHGDLSGNITTSQFKDFINKYIPSSNLTDNAKKTFLIDQSTRSLMFLFTIYFPNSKNWMNVVLHVEFLPTGAIFINSPILRAFNPDIYSINNLLKVIDFVRMSILGLLLFFLIFEIREKFNQFRANFLEVLSANMFITLYMVGSFTITYYLKLRYFSKNKTDLFVQNRDRYIDTFLMGYYYNQIFFIESILFAGICIKVLDFLRINDYVKLFFSSVNLGFSLFIKFMITIVCSLLILTVVSHILWGPFMKEFVNINNSLNQILLFTIGKYNPQTLIVLNSGFTLFYFIVFFIVMIFMMFPVFISVYIESLIKIVTKLGYPEDHISTSWQIRDVINWLCYCLDDHDKKKQNKKKNN